MDKQQKYIKELEDKCAKQVEQIEKLRRALVTLKQQNIIKNQSEHTLWLEQTIDTLRSDNELATSQIEELYNLLNEVMPLRRHVKRQIRHHLVQADTKIIDTLSRKSKFQPLDNPLEAAQSDAGNLLNLAREYDQNNFDAFNKKPKQHPLLPIYKQTRKPVILSLRKVKNSLKKAPNHDD